MTIDTPYVYAFGRDDDGGIVFQSRHIETRETQGYALPHPITEHPMVRDHVITLGTFALSEEEIVKRGGEHPPPWTVEAKALVPVTDSKGPLQHEENEDVLEMVPGVGLAAVIGLVLIVGRSARRICMQ